MGFFSHVLIYLDSTSPVYRVPLALDLEELGYSDVLQENRFKLRVALRNMLLELCTDFNATSSRYLDRSFSCSVSLHECMHNLGWTFGFATGCHLHLPGSIYALDIDYTWTIFIQKSPNWKWLLGCDRKAFDTLHLLLLLPRRCHHHQQLQQHRLHHLLSPTSR